jgi:Focal adhesion targeting region
MLSCAHILAMDTKNLLDVCDSIRQRFPHIKIEQSDQDGASPKIEQIAFLPQSPKKQPLQQAQPVQEEFYENLSLVQRERNESQAEQIYCNQNLGNDMGIYDNSSVIEEQQLKIVEETVLSSNGTNGVEAQ